MLAPQSQLLIRNIELFDEGDWLIINPADAYIGNDLEAQPITFLHQYFDIFSQSVSGMNSVQFDSRDVASKAYGFNVEAQSGLHTHHFCPFLPNDKVYTDILIHMPKAKAQLSLLLAMAIPSLSLDGRIHLVGENKGGIKSANKILAEFGDVEKVDSARHCSLLTCHVNAAVKRFLPDNWHQEIDYQLNDVTWPIYSLPGVFSHGELDNGTKLLLEKIPQRFNGSVLDFACGAGVIGSYLVKQSPQLKATLSDISALGLYCAARTAELNNQTFSLVASDGLKGISGRFNHIVTNPPFHTGIKTDYSITHDFIVGVGQHLLPKGSLYLVANRFLPYPGLLAAQFSPVHTLAQDTQFSVYYATK